MRVEVLDAWHRHDQLDCGAKGPKVRLPLRIDRRHGGLESVDLIEMKAQQGAMVLGHPATKSLTQFLRWRLDPPIGKAGQFGGCPELAKFVVEFTAKWGKVIRAANIKL